MTPETPLACSCSWDNREGDCPVHQIQPKEPTPPSKADPLEEQIRYILSRQLATFSSGENEITTSWEGAVPYLLTLIHDREIAARIEVHQRIVDMSYEQITGESDHFTPCKACGQVSHQCTCDQAIGALKNLAKKRITELRGKNE